MEILLIDQKKRSIGRFSKNAQKSKECCLRTTRQIARNSLLGESLKTLTRLHYTLHLTSMICFFISSLSTLLSASIPLYRHTQQGASGQRPGVLHLSLQ